MWHILYLDIDPQTTEKFLHTKGSLTDFYDMVTV